MAPSTIQEWEFISLSCHASEHVNPSAAALDVWICDEGEHVNSLYFKKTLLCSAMKKTDIKLWDEFSHK